MKTFWRWGISWLLLIAVIGLFACGREQDRGGSKETSTPIGENGAVTDGSQGTSKESGSGQPQSPSDTESESGSAETTETSEPVTTDSGWIPGWY